jgi:hypothetical protein
MQNLPRKNYLGDLNDLTLNQLVVGSTPTRGTNLACPLKARFSLVKSWREINGPRRLFANRPIA